MNHREVIMKQATLLLFVILLILAIASPMQAQDENSVETIKVNDHIYQFRVTTTYDFNILASIGDDGIFLVDTGFPFTAEILYDAIRAVSDKPITFIALSHSHPDHTGGLPLMGDEATIIARDNCLASSYFNLPDRRIFDGPSVEVIKPTTMRINGEFVKFTPVKPGHSDDEMLIHFVDSNILFVGSSVIGDMYFYADPNIGSLDGALARIDWMANAYPDVTFSLAHGDDHTADQFREYVHTLRNSIAIVDEALEAGKTPAEIEEEGLLAHWDSWQSVFTSHAGWAGMINRHRNPAPDDGPPSINEPMSKILEAEGVDTMIDAYFTMVEEQPDDYDYREFHLNMLGYELSYRDRVDEALKVLKLNMDLFPESANVYDSYGEMMLLEGDTTKAIEYYERALEVDPEYQNAADVLERLKG
jgi:glyoxylase-like metal-dependent hydrolase (beta-lactamase superfamily II)